MIGTALKRGIADRGSRGAAIASMLTLNRGACETMLDFDVHGCTDVTGFGLIGHGREMALASNVTLEIESASVQFLPGAVEYARAGAIPGGLKNNREFVGLCQGHICFTGNEDLLYDPQTSGGLLIALPEPDAAELERSLEGAYRIGRVLPRGEKPILLCVKSAGLPAPAAPVRDAAARGPRSARTHTEAHK